MPHSTSEDMSPAPNQEDILLPDASGNGIDNKLEDEESSDSGTSSDHPVDRKEDSAKIDVKLEDLFNDDDESDEEFLSSGPPSGNMPSSPLEAPV